MVRFVDEDGTELQSVKVAYGEVPEYTGSGPAKEPDAQYTYTFAGWDPEVSSVTGDKTYTATYSSTVNEYTVRFVNDDGTVLQSSLIAYGEVPEYTGSGPVKEADAEYTYNFAGWDKDIAAVNGDVTYTATFTAVPKPVEHPATGDNAIFVMWIAVACVCFAAVAVIILRARKRSLQ